MMRRQGLVPFFRPEVPGADGRRLPNTSELRAKIMRCPKCGYLSFDHLEICRGCRKNIAKFSQELSGTVFQSEPPDFLRFEAEEEPQEADDGTAVGAEPEETADDGQDDLAGFSADIDPLEFAAAPDAPEEAKEIEFALPGAAVEEPAEEIAFELPGEEETSAPGKKENSLAPPAADAGMDMSFDDLGGLELGLEDDSGAVEAAPEPPAKGKKEPPAKSKPGGQEKELPSLDLTGLDLSGLTPAEDKEEDFSIGELSLDRPEKGGTEEKGRKAVAAAAKGGLPDIDLGMEGLDFNPTAPAPAGSAAGKKLKPAAKTGTALDDFDFDLGELVAGKVEKPAKPAKAAAARPAAVKKK